MSEAADFNESGRMVENARIREIAVRATETCPINPTGDQFEFFKTQGLLRIMEGKYGEDFHGVTPELASRALIDEFLRDLSTGTLG